MKTIVISPGHGGNNSKIAGGRSNVGIDKRYVEADGNLQFSLYLKEYLKPYFKVVLTREKDESMSLYNRAKIADKYKADLFLCIHSDACGNEKGNGVSVYKSVYNKDNNLGEILGKAISKSMNINFRKVKTRSYDSDPNIDYYGVIRYAYNKGILNTYIIERGFHTNKHECELLLNDDVVKKSARALADVIKKYYKVGDKMDKKDIEKKDIKINLLGNEITLEGLFYNEENYVSIRNLLERLGLIVKWDNENKVIDVSFEVKEED